MFQSLFRGDDGANERVKFLECVQRTGTKLMGSAWNYKMREVVRSEDCVCFYRELATTFCYLRYSHPETFPPKPLTHLTTSYGKKNIFFRVFTLSFPIPTHLSSPSEKLCVERTEFYTGWVSFFHIEFFPFSRTHSTIPSSPM